MFISLTRKLATASRARISSRVTKVFLPGQWHGCPCKIFLSSKLLTMQNLIVMYHTAICRGPKKFGVACAPPIGMKVADPMQIRSSPCHAKFGRSIGQTDRTYVQRYAGKYLTPSFASRLSRPLKVIGTDTDRSAACYFLLVICSNSGDYLVPFQRQRRLRSKSQFFPASCI